MEHFYEYNEECGSFYENIGTTKVGTNGYKVICEVEPNFFTPFRKHIRRVYDFDSGVYPSFDVVSKEWKEYLLIRKDLDLYK